MEPKDVMHRYASEAGGHGLLKHVSDEYQRRVTANRDEIRRMSIGSGIATGCVMLRVIFGALTFLQDRLTPTPAATAFALAALPCSA